MSSALTKSIVFLCCRLLGEFLLPPSNFLPRMYHDLHAIMKYIGMEYQSIHACLNDDILYYKEHLSKDKCPKCDESRYQIDNVTKKVARKVLHYNPIITHLQQLSRCKCITQLMDYH